MKFTKDKYRAFNSNVLTTFEKLQGVALQKLDEEPTHIQNFVSENIGLLNTDAGYEKFMKGIEGTAFAEVCKNISTASISNAVSDELSSADDMPTASDIGAFFGYSAEKGDSLESIKNSLDEENETAMSNVVEILNSYEPSANGDVGLNRVMTTLSVRLAEVIRQKILTVGTSQYFPNTMGKCAYKKELIQLGMGDRIPTPESMMSVVGGLSFDETGSIEINQKSIPVYQYGQSVIFNRINEIMTRSLNISLVDELVRISNVAFENAIGRGLQYGCTSAKDGSTFKGILNYEGATADTSVWAKELGSHKDVEAFAERLLAKWKTESQVGYDDEDAIIHPFNKIVMPTAIASSLEAILLTDAGFPAGTSKDMTVFEYFKAIIEKKMAVWYGQSVSVDVVTSPFANAKSLTKIEGASTVDRMVIYSTEGSVFDISMVGSFGFNTADNVNMTSRLLMFMTKPELARQNKDVLVVSKGY